MPTLTISSRDLRRRFPFILALLLPLLVANPSNAQVIKVIGNKAIMLHADVNNNSGRFWFSSAGTSFLYNQLGNYITSNVVFKISRSGSDQYYCNLPTTSTLKIRPQAPGGGSVPFAPYDSLYISKGTDTMAMVWRNLDGYKIVMRFVAEQQTTLYDTGGDILLEFDYGLNPFATAGDFGIFLMLDTYNDENNASSSGDNTSILTDLTYFPQTGAGKLYVQPFDTIPQFYLAGNFRYNLPLNTSLAVHRLRGTSHGGAPLTTPSTFAIGSWTYFRNYAWDVSNVSNTISDCATICRWDNLGGGGHIRTAFGLSDQGGNNLFTCRDSSMFVSIRTTRLVTQSVKNGPYSPSQFDVEVWVTNLSETLGLNPVITLDYPIASTPKNTHRLTFPVATAAQSVQLPPRGTKKLTWRLSVDPASTDTLSKLQFRYTIPNRLPNLTFRLPCTPLVSVFGYQDPPPPDSLPPVIQRGTPGRNTTVFYPFTTFDRHPNFNFDTGLDTNRITILSNLGNNFTLKKTPTKFTQCDVNETIGLTFSVVDTTKPAKVVFAVYDCQGNVSRDSAGYNPRPDLFKPEIVRIDSLPSNGCNTRRYEVKLRDYVNQRPDAGDNGFGRVEVSGTADNFTFEPNFNLPPLKDFDSIANFAVAVIDTMRDGDITVWFSDYAGNADSMTFHYCTLPDTAAPKSTVAVLAGARTWQIDASDTASWDRGIKEVVALSNLGNNMSFAPQSYGPTVRTTSFQVGVIDDAKDADIVVEIRDSIFATQPAGHADTVHILFNHIPDIMAPNIIYTPVPGTRGSKSDVEVNDIHPGYKYDLGLATVTALAITPNMRFAIPINFASGDMKTTFQVEVIDTLAIRNIDSVCIEATDLAGNTSMLCYRYPLVPDQKVPIFSASLSADRTAISGLVTDSRDYDRGLGSVTIENPVNLDPLFTMTNLKGVASVPVAVNVIDPERPISGTFVVRDLIGDNDNSDVTRALHTVRIPFWLPTVTLAVRLPGVAEGNSEFASAIIAEDTIPVSQVSSMEFQLHYTGDVEFRGATGVRTTLSATPGALGTIGARIVTQAGTPYSKGDTLGLLTFFGHQASDVTDFRMDLAGGINVNGGALQTITVPTAGDTALSQIVLPPPFMKVVSDSLTYVNGTCSRVLSGTRGGNSKRTALEILSVKPQPYSIGGGAMLQLDVQNLPATEATADLVTADGRMAAQLPVPRAAGGLSRISLTLPEQLPSGVYFLRLRGSTGSDWARIVVVR